MRCMLFVVWCALCVVRRASCVVRCVLRVVCCGLCVMYYVPCVLRSGFYVKCRVWLYVLCVLCYGCI